MKRRLLLTTFVIAFVLCLSEPSVSRRRRQRIAGRQSLGTAHARGRIHGLRPTRCNTTFLVAALEAPERVPLTAQPSARSGHEMRRCRPDPSEKLMLYVLIIVILVVAAILVLAARQPDTFRVARSTTANAPPDAVFSQIVDFHHWHSWSPFEKLDPSMKKTFSGADNGVGAVYAWDGNSKAGAGRMEIVDTRPPQRVTLNLAFTRPFKAENVTDFTMEPEDGGTRVTWAMHGKNSFFSKLMGIFVSMDKLIGKDFEEGLANLKRNAEAASQPSTSP